MQCLFMCHLEVIVCKISSLHGRKVRLYCLYAVVCLSVTVLQWISEFLFTTPSVLCEEDEYADIDTFA